MKEELDKIMVEEELPKIVIFKKHCLDTDKWFLKKCVNKDCNKVVGYLNGLTPTFEFGMLCVECAKKQEVYERD